MPLPSMPRTTGSGRPAEELATAEDVARLRAMYVRTNAHGCGGSKRMAARILAERGELSAGLTARVLDPEARALPESVANAMHVGRAVFARQRDPRRQALNGAYVPGSLRMTHDAETGELRRLLGGERQSWDDATINFGVCVPWPWGGDKCSDKYGCRVGRFQLLAAADHASDYVPGFSYVIRDEQSYRAEDVVRAEHALWRTTYAPGQVVHEGGAWQAGRTIEWLRETGVEMLDAKGRPQLKRIEAVFGKLWTILATLPGDVGRFRGENVAGTKLYLACRAGSVDPRRHFLALPDAIREIGSALDLLNRTRVESRRYGSWIPLELHEAGLSRVMREPLGPGLEVFAAPVRVERKVFRGMVQLTAEGPIGESVYWFGGGELMEWEGCHVRVLFDPWAQTLGARVELARDHHGARAGTLIASALPCCGDAPVLRGRDLDIVSLALTNGLAARKGSQARVRQEHAVIGAGGDGLRAVLAGVVGTEMDATEMDATERVPPGRVDATERVYPKRVDGTERVPPGRAMLSRFELCEA